jgi:dienelactone hydrolase
MVPIARQLACLACLLLAVATAGAQAITIKPGPDVLAGDPVSLHISGVAPGARVTVRTERVVAEWGPPLLFRAHAVFVADAQGEITPDTQAPVAGSYSGADARGLFWSATPAGPAPAERPANEVRITAEIDGMTPLQARLRVLSTTPDVQTERTVDGLPGAVFATRGNGKRPALILLGGSEGGSFITRYAAQFAARGYAVLAVPYYSPPRFAPTGMLPPELPQLPAGFVDIPVERLERARAWLAQRPEVDATRIGVYGISKGAEFALLAASRMPWITAVVAVVPSDVVWEGWDNGAPKTGVYSSFAVDGKPLPFVPYEGFQEEMAGFATGREVRIRRPHDAGRARYAERVDAARIPVERIRAPVMVIGGGDDQVWDSGTMARNIAARRDAARLPTVALIYPDAGHALSGTGWMPTTSYNMGPMKIGGTPAANARAQAQAWEETLRFLATHLQPPP